MNVAAHIARVIASLPEEVQKQLGSVRFRAMEEPDDFLAECGVRRDWKGACFCFDEEPYLHPLETFVYIFTGNIDPLTEESVEIVLLHEIAHALGMDEHEVRAIGLGPEALQCH